MASSSTITQQLINSSNDSALFDYMKQFVEYQETGVDLPELSQLRQLDIYLQNCYHHIQEYVTNLREKQYGTQTEANIQTKLVDALIQAKAIGDKKMQLSQQMLDITERQSKKLKLAHQKYIDSSNQQSTSSNDNDSDHEFDVEIHSTRSLTNKASTTSLWKRKATTTTTTTTTTPPASTATNNHNSTPSTLGLKRKCVVNSEQNIEQRERKKVTQRNCNSNGQNSCSGNQKKFKLNNDSSSTHSDEPTYCLCSQLSYGSMILCDSKSCEIKWFHFNCVNLTTKPKGKWYCPNCRDNRS